jgi:hypothetical protein
MQAGINSMLYRILLLMDLVLTRTEGKNGGILTYTLITHNVTDCGNNHR